MKQTTININKNCVIMHIKTVKQQIDTYLASIQHKHANIALNHIQDEVNNICAIYMHVHDLIALYDSNKFQYCFNIYKANNNIFAAHKIIAIDYNLCHLFNVKQLSDITLEHIFQFCDANAVNYAIMHDIVAMYSLDNGLSIQFKWQYCHKLDEQHSYIKQQLYKLLDLKTLKLTV